MNKKILAIAAIALFLAMALIPAATADIKTLIPSEEETPPSPPQPQWILSGHWIMAFIRCIIGEFPVYDEGWLIDVENLTYTSSFKFGNRYIYKDVHVIGTVDVIDEEFPALSSLVIGRLISFSIAPWTKVSLTASWLINHKPLEIQEDGKLYFFSTVFNAKLELLEE